ncbi:unnamed protein product [Mytilus edulis]|uniref:Uncharacterized protein n=1 Tax=Mytilus edulis TaxID=6550 RepID=A0A8S3RB18_MYTED|nr:unnamed protein product [Mytilus edulis]
MGKIFWINVSTTSDQLKPHKRIRCQSIEINKTGVSRIQQVLNRDIYESLKDDDSIIIKEADKGGAIIIMDTNFYKEKVMEQLNDEEYYKQITNNPDKATKKRLKKLIKDYDQCLTEKEIAYLCDFDPKESNFYGLPKVHKSAQIQNTVRDQNNVYVETFRPADLKLRPIIAGPESLTQRLSHFIDLIIKHICPLIPSYIKDDMEFLNHIPAIVPEETLLTSFDVTSLYTNIPHDLGITAVKYWIEEKRDEIDSRFETNFILEAIKIVLEENTFYFDGKKYRQIKEIPSGAERKMYLEAIQSGTEVRQYVRIFVVGKHGVGKTSLVRRLLGKGLDDVESTDGIDIDKTCQIRTSDGEWIVGEGELNLNIPTCN